MAKVARVSVDLDQCRGQVDKMIRRFTKKVKKEGLLETMRDNRYYKKPSVAKKEKRIRTERRRLREEKKRQRAKERTRNRKT